MKKIARVLLKSQVYLTPLAYFLASELFPKEPQFEAGATPELSNKENLEPDKLAMDRGLF